MFYIVADLRKRETVPIKYAEREDAESMANMLNDMGMGEWLTLALPSEPDL